MRFNWDAAYNKSPNAEALEKIFNSLRATGAKRCPAANEDLENICDNDLKERIKDKFVSMAREFKSKRKEQANLQARIQELEDRRAAAEENLDEELADEPAIVITTASRDRASKNSRVSSVSHFLNENAVVTH
jgi:predicted  nucleic acid-binding Zn-ribbon protein